MCEFLDNIVKKTKCHLNLVWKSCKNYKKALNRTLRNKGRKVGEYCRPREARV